MLANTFGSYEKRLEGKPPSGSARNTENCILLKQSNVGLKLRQKSSSRAGGIVRGFSGPMPVSLVAFPTKVYFANLEVIYRNPFSVALNQQLFAGLH